MPFVTTNPTPDLEDSPIQLYYFDTASGIFKGIGDPNNLVVAGVGSLFPNTSGQVYLKTTGLSLSTGWTLIPLDSISGATNFERVFHRNVIAASTSGLGVDPLHQITYSANSLSFNGQGSRIFAQGSFSGALGNKRLLVTLNGLQGLLDTGLVAINNSNWTFESFITRFNSTTFYCASWVRFGGFGVTATPVLFTSTLFQAGQLFTVNNSIDFSGEVANAGDTVSQDISIATIL